MVYDSFKNFVSGFSSYKRATTTIDVASGICSSSELLSVPKNYVQVPAA